MRVSHECGGLLAGTALALVPAAALAQQIQATSQDAGQQAHATSDDIVVTGKVPPGSVIGDIPPENRLNRADIDSYGVSTISELLDAISDQTQSIEGRSDDGPIVLVNGKRISGVNEVKDVPTEAVVRVDILPEEVALKYGYDAQRKVVNILLRRRFQAKVVNGSASRATEGGGQTGNGDFLYTRIRDNNRLNIGAHAASTAALYESERDVIPASGTGEAADDTASRTLKPSTRSYGINASIARELSAKTNLSINLQSSYATSDALNGLAASNDRPLRDYSETVSAGLGASLNSELSSRWQLSVIGGYTHGDTRRETDRLDGRGGASSTRTVSLSDTANASVLVHGKLFHLPAGDVGMSLRLGGDFSALDTRGGTSRQSGGDADRTDAGGQVSLDLPIASRRAGFLSPLGKLTANLNASATNVSDYGTLGTFGYGLNWTPVTGLSLIVAVNEDRSAPTLSQRNDAVVVTANTRVYDYATGTTAIVSSITGGNPTLKADDRHVLKLGLTAKPFTKVNLTFSASYSESRTRNEILSVSGVSAALEAAFPNLYRRDADGDLVSIDSRAINIAREDRDRLRWGFNFTQVLRKPKRPALPPGFVPPWVRARMAEGAAPATGRSGQGDAETPGHDQAASRPDAEHGGPEHGEGDDIVVNGKAMDDPSGPRPPGDFGGPDGDFGPPPGGPPPGGPPPDGFGPPPGGFGGPGGPGGPGGFGPPPGGPGGPPGGSGNGAQFQFSLYHSVTLRDVVVLRDGLAPIDLLDGGTLGGTATPRHTVQLATGVIDNGVGLRLTGNWKSAAHATSDAATGDLRFGALATFDLRLFVNLANRLPGKRWARGMRISLSVSNLFDVRQTVRDASGATPLAYQKDYLDPYGRTVALSLRRIF